LHNDPDSKKPLEVKIETLKREDLKSDSTPEIKALSNEVFSTLREVISMNPMLRDQVQYFVERYDVTDPSKLADLTGILCQVASSSELQDLFETYVILKSLEQRHTPSNTNTTTTTGTALEIFWRNHSSL